MDLNRLAKIWRLTTSSNAGEAAAARERARVIVAREGKTLADVPGLLRGCGGSPAPGAAGFTFYDMANPDHVGAFAEKDRERRAKRAAKEAPERAEVLARYGGTVDAVLAWTEHELLLRAAVAKWTVSRPAPHERWVKTIDGHDHMTPGKVPDRVACAISTAYPLPTTITQAAREFAEWERRDRDIGLAVEDTSDIQLDLPAYLRREIVRSLLETGLRAASLEEVLIRQRYVVDHEISGPQIEKAILRDLEALVAAGVGERAPAAPSA